MGQVPPTGRPVTGKFGPGPRDFGHQPADLTREDGYHDHRRQVQLVLAGGHRGGPRAAVPMNGTLAQEAAAMSMAWSSLRFPRRDSR
jgi:hypothetical protein